MDFDSNYKRSLISEMINIKLNKFAANKKLSPYLLLLFMFKIIEFYQFSSQSNIMLKLVLIVSLV